MLTQFCPLLQEAQAAPPVPQALLALPGWQVVFRQQPAGHDAALHAHTPLTHAWPCAQGGPLPHAHFFATQLSAPAPHVVHWEPGAPHAAGVVPL